MNKLFVFSLFVCFSIFAVYQDQPIPAVIVKFMQDRNSELNILSDHRHVKNFKADAVKVAVIAGFVLKHIQQKAD